MHAVQQIVRKKKKKSEIYNKFTFILNFLNSANNECL